VVITEYDLPRQTIAPHDVRTDVDGFVWYSNFVENELGRLDPKSLEYTEVSIPAGVAADDGRVPAEDPLDGRSRPGSQLGHLGFTQVIASSRLFRQPKVLKSPFKHGKCAHLLGRL